MRIEISDITGKVMEKIADINTYTYTISRKSLLSGMYILKVEMKKGIGYKKIVLE